MFAAPSRLGVASGARPRRVPHRRAAMAASDPAPFAVSDDDSLVTFFTHSLCPYAHRTALALAEKGVPHRRVHVDLSNKPRWYLDLNPRGLVPALETADGAVLTESLDLVEFVDEAFEGPNLAPPGRELEARRLARSFDGGFVSAGLQFVGGGWGFSRGAPDPARRSRFARECEALGDLVDANGGPFLLGAEISVADIAVYPFAERFETAAREFKRTELRDLGGDGFGRWLDAMRRRPSVEGLRPDEDALLASWRRTMRLDYFDYETADVYHP